MADPAAFKLVEGALSSINDDPVMVEASKQILAMAKIAVSHQLRITELETALARVDARLVAIEAERATGSRRS